MLPHRRSDFTRVNTLKSEAPFSSMIYGYVRVSTAEQSADSQKSLIARYVVDRRWTVDEWMEQGRLCG